VRNSGKGLDYQRFRRDFEPVGRGVFNPFKPEVPLRGLEVLEGEKKYPPKLELSELWKLYPPPDVVMSAREGRGGAEKEGGGGLRPDENCGFLCQSVRGPVYRWAHRKWMLDP